MRIAELHREARAELDEAADFYEGRQLGLGDEFLDEFLAAVRRIERSPEQFPAKRGVLRKCVLKRFPFSIYFWIDTDRIKVVAVAHGSRRPGYWKQRILDEQR